MKQPLSPLPWSIEIEEEEMSSSELTPDKVYYVIPNKPQEIEGSDWREPVLSNRRYYNTAPEELQDAEYIVEACNNYPKAVDLLKRSYEVLPVGVKSYIDQLEKEVGEFLKSIE